MKNSTIETTETGFSAILEEFEASQKSETSSTIAEVKTLTAQISAAQGLPIQQAFKTLKNIIAKMRAICLASSSKVLKNLYTDALRLNSNVWDSLKDRESVINKEVSSIRTLISGTVSLATLQEVVKSLEGLKMDIYYPIYADIRNNISRIVVGILSTGIAAATSLTELVAIAKDIKSSENLLSDRASAVVWNAYSIQKADLKAVEDVILRTAHEHYRNVSLAGNRAEIAIAKESISTFATSFTVPSSILDSIDKSIAEREASITVSETLIRKLYSIVSGPNQWKEYTLAMYDVKDAKLQASDRKSVYSVATEVRGNLEAAQAEYKKTLALRKKAVAVVSVPQVQSIDMTIGEIVKAKAEELAIA